MTRSTNDILQELAREQARLAELERTRDEIRAEIESLRTELAASSAKAPCSVRWPPRRNARHGAGGPLLLLHGGFGTLEMFGPVLDSLAERRLVITVDLYGHGRTALTDRPIETVAIGNDMATLVKALGLSFGAMVAFQFAAHVS